MDPLGWILLGVGLWVVVSIGVSIITGRMIARRDRDDPARTSGGAWGYAGPRRTSPLGELCPQRADVLAVPRDGAVDSFGE